jgi:phenylalanyl-tRNA synthetase beta chain
MLWSERIVTLDDVDRELSSDDLVIVDADGPTSMAGTMGGARSEVVDGTRNVLMEAASWDPRTIMWMSRRHMLTSEASKRFERGVDRSIPLRASTRACKLLIEMTGAELLDGVIDVVAVEPVERLIELTEHDVARLLGPGFDTARVTAALGSIGLTVTGTEPMSVTVPTFRPDLERPVDLVEEVARLAGYDTFPDTVPTGAAGGLTDQQRRTRIVREVLVGAGLNQAVHLSFMSLEDLDHLGLPVDHDARSVVTVSNPLRDEESKLRTTLLPGLLGSLRYNIRHGAKSVALFETGKVFFARPSSVDTRIPHQPDRLGFAIVGGFGPGGLIEPARPADVFTATSLWRAIAGRLGLESVVEPASAPGFHPGRCASVSVDGRSIGHVGELHPKAAEAYGFGERVAVGELDLEAISEPVDAAQLATPSTFPPVEFDLAFVVGDDLAAADLVDRTRDAGGELVAGAAVFDEYRGSGRRSIAIRYELRSPERTLTNEDAAPVRRSMVEAATVLGAELRGEA